MSKECCFYVLMSSKYTEFYDYIGNKNTFFNSYFSYLDNETNSTLIYYIVEYVKDCVNK